MRCCLLALVCWSLAGVASAQSSYAIPYDGTQAGLDTYSYNESLRRQGVNRQLNAIEQVRWQRGLPPAGARPDYVYVTGRRGLLGRYRQRVYYGYAPREIVTRRYISPRYVPDPVYDGTVPQSIGQRQVQTGPDRWESHPVYREPVRPAAAPLDPPPPVEPPPEDFAPPRSTAREF